MSRNCKGAMERMCGEGEDRKMKRLYLFSKKYGMMSAEDNRKVTTGKGGAA